MTNVLVVVRPFDTHKLGDVIREAEEIHRVTEGANARDVVRVKTKAFSTSKQGEI